MASPNPKLLFLSRNSPKALRVFRKARNSTSNGFIKQLTLALAFSENLGLTPVQEIVKVYAKNKFTHKYTGLYSRVASLAAVKIYIHGEGDVRIMGYLPNVVFAYHLVNYITTYLNSYEIWLRTSYRTKAKKQRLKKRRDDGGRTRLFDARKLASDKTNSVIFLTHITLGQKLEQILVLKPEAYYGASWILKNIDFYLQQKYGKNYKQKM